MTLPRARLIQTAYNQSTIRLAVSKSKYVVVRMQIDTWCELGLGVKRWVVNVPWLLVRSEFKPLLGLIKNLYG